MVVRTRGWFNILRASYPHEAALRARDVTCAYLAGRGLKARVKQGFAEVRSPRQFMVGVVGPQAASRAVRLVALACFMAAFGLPVSVNTVVLVMAAQGAGRLVPLAPVSAGLRVAMLS